MRCSKLSGFSYFPDINRFMRLVEELKVLLKIFDLDLLILAVIKLNLSGILFCFFQVIQVFTRIG